MYERKNHVFKVYVEVKEGFRRVTEMEEENEIIFTIEASCLANANRMVKAILSNNDNVIEYDLICIE